MGQPAGSVAKTQACLILATVFTGGIVVGLLLGQSIALPFEDSWSVVGPPRFGGFNPTTNLVRFLVLVSLPPLLLLLLFVLARGRLHALCFSGGGRRSPLDELPAAAWSPRFSSVATVVFALVIALSIPTTRATGPLDTFHEGEALGTTESYLSGRVPYRDFVIPHGMIQDVLRPALAFALFGRSIGAARTLESVAKLLTVALLAVFLLQFYRRRFLYASGTVFLLAALRWTTIPPVPFFVVIYPRDVVTFGFLTTIPLLQRYLTGSGRSAVRLALVAFVFSFLPVASLGYSVDRGVFLCVLYVFAAPVVWLLLHEHRLRRGYTIACVLGLSAGLGVLALLVRVQLAAFVDFALLSFPRYQDLLAGHVYVFSSVWFGGICVLIAANVFWYTRAFLKELEADQRQLGRAVSAFLTRHFTELCLLAASLMYFRGALGRADWEHVASGALLTYILALLVFVKYYAHAALRRRVPGARAAYPAVVAFVLLAAFPVYWVYRDNLIAKNFPLAVTDDRFVPARFRETIRLLRTELKDGEDFATLTSEGVWYYLVGRPSPTRFPVVWYAAPGAYQREMVASLSARNVKFIIYENGSWANRIDDIPNRDRLPLVFEYVHRRYRFFRTIDDNVIWIRRDGTS